MMMADTIIAIATPIGRGGIGILRVSGNLVPTIAQELHGKIPKPRKAEYLPFLSKNNCVLERVIVLFFPEPNSFTGENVLEIHSHGGQIILDILLNRVLEISSSIRLANPGEFTERAFLNGKIDLIQAEAVADIIDATSYQAAKSASNSLQGIFSKRIHIILEKIVNLRAHIELSIDFSEEKLDNISFDEVYDLLKEIIKDTDHIYKSACYGLLTKEGLKLVIAGKPNAGKSSLFNILLGVDRAIVSDIPGTTRDTLCEAIQLNRIPCYITDTAGLSENSVDKIEIIGVQRALHELTQSDHILWVVDSSNFENKDRETVLSSIKEMFSAIEKTVPITIVRNKSDLSSESVGITVIGEYTCVTLSVLLNKGVDLLKKYLHDVLQSQIQKCFKNCIFEENQSNFIARKRHVDILKKVLKYLWSAQKQLLNRNMLFFAEELRFAHDELNKIFGKVRSDEVLKKIFSTFCIGK